MNSSRRRSTGPDGQRSDRRALAARLAIAGALYFVAIALPLIAVAHWHRNFGVWPAVAVGIVAILGTPVRQQPWMVLVTALANLAALAAFSHNRPPVIAGLVLVHVIEEWGSVVVIRRWVSTHVDFSRTVDLVRFAAAVMVWTPLMALLGAIVYYPVANLNFAITWFAWWSPDAVWVMLFVPSFWFLTQIRVDRIRYRLRSVAEQAMFLLVFSTVLVWVLFPGDPLARRMPLGLVVMPFLMFAAARLGPGATTWSVTLMALFSILATNAGVGPFATANTPVYLQLILAQAYSVGVGAASIFLSTVIHERELAASRIQAFFRSTPGMITIVDTDRRLVARTTDSAALHDSATLHDSAALHDGATLHGGATGDEPNPPDAAEFGRSGSVPARGVLADPAWTRALSGDSSTVTLDLGQRGLYELSYHPLRGEHGEVVGAASIGEDMARSARESAERQRAQRFEALGRLAGGIAHDINNLLTVILGQVWMLDDGRGADHPHAEELATLQDAVDRMKALTQQLLAFARAQIISPRVLTLNAQLEAMEPLLVRLIEERVEIDFRYATDLWPVNVDPSQFDQVVLNLCTNARDAMPDGGRIEVSTANVMLDALEARRLLVAPGEYVCLTVRDTGVGIAPDVLGRIFEPFYSSKEISKGFGLGLATVEGIVRQAGGAIGVTSVVGDGTRFRLYLPRARGPVAPAVAAAPALRTLRGEGFTILLCEDEAPVRRLMVRVLGRHGYQVLEAARADEALALAKVPTRRIDLLVSDVVMPGMGGGELAQALRRLYPSLPVLLVTGYAQDALVTSGVPLAGMDLLAKPFSAEQLLDRVQRALDGTRAGGGA